MYDIGIIPLRLSNPTVGLIPTKPLALAGHVIDPLVSVPMVNMARFADAATPEPALDPQGLLLGSYGFLVCPPRPLQPLEEKLE